MPAHSFRRMIVPMALLFSNSGCRLLTGPETATVRVSLASDTVIAVPQISPDLSDISVVATLENKGNVDLFLYQITTFARLEKLDAGQWRTVYLPISQMDIGPPYVLKPGQTRKDVAFINSKRMMRVGSPGVDGTYRVVYAVFRKFGLPLGLADPLPEEATRSAPFVIRSQ